MSSWQCKKRHGDSFSSHGTVCAGSPPDTSLLHGSSDGCRGNSGGGLLCQSEAGRWVLAGVVAGGYGCADTSSPALYTRVSRFRSWIDEVTWADSQNGRQGEDTNDIGQHAHTKHTHHPQMAV